jgi:hypothetical protein
MEVYVTRIAKLTAVDYGGGYKLVTEESAFSQFSFCSLGERVTPVSVLRYFQVNNLTILQTGCEFKQTTLVPIHSNLMCKIYYKRCKLRRKK